MVIGTDYIGRCTSSYYTIVATLNCHIIAATINPDMIYSIMKYRKSIIYNKKYFFRVEVFICTSPLFQYKYSAPEKVS